MPWDRHLFHGDDGTVSDLPDTDDTSFDDLSMGTTLAGSRPVSELLTDDVPMLDPTISLRAAAVEMRSSDVSLAVVRKADGSGIGGVISERDFVRAIADGIDLDATDVATVEAENLKWATEDASIDTVAQEMLESYLRHILVSDGAGGVAGVVSMRDLLVAYLV